jgi:hypothetical protein
LHPAEGDECVHSGSAFAEPPSTCADSVQQCWTPSTSVQETPGNGRSRCYDDIVRRRFVAGVCCGFSLLACAKLAGIEDPDRASPGGADTTAEAGTVETPSNLEGDVDIFPTNLEFGPVTCGAEAIPQTITIRNRTSLPIAWDARLPEGSRFLIKGPAAGTAQPNESITLSVTVSPTSASDVTGGVIVSAGKSFVEVLTHVKGMGSVLEFVPGQVDFGEVRKGTTATPIPVELKNTGTTAATITGFTGTTALDLTWDQAPSSLSIPPGESRTLNATFAAPAQTGDLTATLAPLVTEATAKCADLPSLKMAGESINNEVTISVADFGVQACNTPPATREITISNYSNAAITIASATFTEPSRFSVTTSTPVVIPAATGATPATGKVVIGAKPTGLMLGAGEENLHLDITGVGPPGGGARATKVRIDVQGAILTFNPSVLNFTSNGSKRDSDVFPITNTGNASITVDYVFARTKGAAAWFYERDTHVLAPNQTMPVDMAFQPPTRGGDKLYEATLTPRRRNGATSCTPMPVATARGTRQ